MRVRSVLADVREQLGLGLVVMRLGELHHGAVRFPGKEERLLPLRVGDVDVHRVKARGAHALERSTEVGHLDREVVRSGAVPCDEAREEVVSLDIPRLEQLDRHAVAVVGAEPHLHRPEPDRLPAEDDRATELTGEETQCGRSIGRGERDVVEVVRVGHEPGRLGQQLGHAGSGRTSRGPRGTSRSRG